jgi:hypothetical protein
VYVGAYAPTYTVFALLFAEVGISLVLQ